MIFLPHQNQKLQGLISCSVSMEDFPDSLLVEILRRLPLKSIFRFRSVSKHWLSIISDPFFSHTYTHHLNVINNNSGPPWTAFSTFHQVPLDERTIIRHPGLGSTGFSLQFMSQAVSTVQQTEGSSSIKLLDSSNGLLLLCSICDSQIQNYYVCNPLTMKWVCIPKPLNQPKWVKSSFLCDEDSGNFMVVRVAELRWRSRVFNFEIFSSEAGEWKYFKVLCPRRIRFFVQRRHTLSYQGIIHWLVDNYTILAFDPKSNTNECRLIDLPSDRESRIIGILGVSCGLFRYIEVSDTYLERSQPRTLGVWLLSDYDAGEWSLEYRFELSELWSDDASINALWASCIGTTRALVFHPFDYDVVFLSFSSLLLCCHLSTRMVESVDCEGRVKESFYNCEVFPFVLPSWPTQFHTHLGMLYEE